MLKYAVHPEQHLPHWKHLNSSYLVLLQIGDRGKKRIKMTKREGVSYSW
jgi:hypothetical protein